MMTPECAFARLGNTLNVYQLIQAGTDLCAQYYVDGHTGDIERRKAYLTSPERLSNYLEHAGMIKGSKKAVHALRFVLPNSGSPRETLMNIQFNIPLRMGSFALGLNAMNYDINAGRLATLFDQNSYSIPTSISASNTMARITIPTHGRTQGAETNSEFSDGASIQ